MTLPHDQPRDVFQEGGEVIIDGPCGAVIAMTPEAALRTAGRLDDAALEALIERAKPGAKSPLPRQPSAKHPLHRPL